MKILFQGDSVTDAGRDRSNPHDMGEGYPRYASAMIQDSYPDTGFEFVNLGISGNRTADLVSRLESDFVDVRPDIVSVMIGINDVWHHYAFTYIETTDAEFEANLRLILTALRERTHARILLIQPVLLFGGTDEMRQELKRKQAIFARLAETYADAYLPMDDILREAHLENPAEYAADGIHPTPDGAMLIGEAYLRAVAPLIEACVADGERD